MLARDVPHRLAHAREDRARARCTKSANGTPAITSHHPAEHVDAHAVVPLRAGLEQPAAARPSRSHTPPRSSPCGTPHSKPACRYSASTGWRLHEPVRQPAGVGEQVPHAHLPGDRLGLRRTAEPPAPTCGRRTTGCTVRTGSLSSNPPCSQSTSVAHRRDRLGHRVDPPDRVGLHGQPRLDVVLRRTCWTCASCPWRETATSHPGRRPSST